MGNNESPPVGIAFEGLRKVVDELSATHAAPFTIIFFEEHLEAIERALARAQYLATAKYTVPFRLWRKSVTN
jgi:hypothetical protein